MIVLHAVFFFYALHSGNIYLHNDSDEYLHQAENLKQHHSWYAGNLEEPVNNYLVSRRPPLTGLLILTIKSIYNSDYAVCLIQCVLSIFNLLLIIKLIRQFFPPWNSSGNMLLLLLFFPTQMIYSNMIMAEVFFQTMVILSFYFFVQFIQLKKSYCLFLFHLFVTAAVLIKPVLYFFWIPLIIFMMWLLKKKLIKVFHLSYLLIFIVSVFLISFHNFKKTGYFHYSSVNENYLVNYSIYLTLVDNNKGAEAEKRIAQIMNEAKTKANYNDYSVFIRKESVKIIMENFPTFLYLQVKGIFNFFLDHGRWDMYAFFDKPPGENMHGWKYYYQQEGFKGAVTYLKQFPVLLFIYLLIIYAVNVLVTVAFLLFLFDKRIKPEIRLIIFLFVAYIALMTGMIGSARFRMAVYPFLLFAFVFGFEKLKKLGSSFRVFR